jgi:hypothetical protein
MTTRPTPAPAPTPADFIDLYAMNIDWNTPANSSIATLPRIAITEFNSWFRNYSTFATVPQPGSTSKLDPIREVILNQLVYRNMGTHEAIVGTFATNQNSARTGTVVDSGVRWFELRRPAPATGRCTRKARSARATPARTTCSARSRWTRTATSAWPTTSPAPPRRPPTPRCATPVARRPMRSA